MRECVLFDAEEASVVNFLDNLMSITTDALQRWGISHQVVTANDPFFSNSATSKRAFQTMFALKRELKLPIPGGSLGEGAAIATAELAAASCACAAPPASAMPDRASTMARLRQEAGKEEAAAVTTRMVILSGKVTTVVCKIITRFEAPQHTPLPPRHQQACGLTGDSGSRQAII